MNIKNDNYQSKEINIPFMDASELKHMQFEKRDFLIENLLARNLTLLAGPPKIGKSFLCLSFAKQIISTGKKPIIALLKMIIDVYIKDWQSLNYFRIT